MTIKNYLTYLKMFKNLIFLFISLSLMLWICQAKDQQTEFDEALSKFYRNLNEIKFNENIALNRALDPNMRRSTEEAKLLDELFKFKHEFSKNKTHNIAKRQSPEELSKEPGITISPSYCPFNRPISCSATSKYRFQKCKLMFLK